MEAIVAESLPRTPPRNRVFPVFMPPRPLSIEVDAILEKEAAVLSPTGPRTRSPSVTPMSRLPSPTAEELVLREHMDLLMLDVANKSQEAGLSLEDAFPEDAAKVTSSELTAFLEQAGLENAAETADELIAGCKKYVGDKTPMSPAELKVHTLKQALRVAVAKSLRPRSRSSCHSSPSTVPNSRLTTPLSTHVTGSPTLALIEENPQPLQASPPSPGSRKKPGRTRFGRSPDSASLQRSPERAPRALSVTIDENQPVVPARKELGSPPRGLASAESFACQNGARLQRETSKEAALFGSPPKQPFVELRDLNSKPLPGFISQVAITASAKQHLAAGAAGFGSGTQRKLAFGPEGKADDLFARFAFPGSARGKKRASRRKYRQVPGDVSGETGEATDVGSAAGAPSSEAAEGASKTPPLSPLDFLMKLTSLWQRDSPKAADRTAVEAQ